MHEQFGRYILLERIAIGGMAEIFKAKAPGLGGFEKVLAIKRLHPRYSQDADFIEMLIDEARITVELAHSNIGQIFDLGKVDDHYFIAMEYIEGRDLYRVMKRLRERRQQFPFDAAAYVAMESCAGLDYAHRKRDGRQRPLHIIHRDVSPQNVLLSMEGDVKLVDFGIAKAALRAYETESGIIKGKFYYMSPEQARGEHLDHRTDIFSLGIVLYEMLTGDLLYKDDDDVTLLSKVRRADIAPPSTMRPDLPPALERIAMRALSKDREDRYPSAQHMQRDLARYLRDTGAVFNKARLGQIMHDLFVDEPAGSLNADELLRDRIELGQDARSVISVANFEPEVTEVDSEESQEHPSLGSEMLELSGDDIELIEASMVVEHPRAPAGREPQREAAREPQREPVREPQREPARDGRRAEARAPAKSPKNQSSYDPLEAVVAKVSQARSPDIFEEDEPTRAFPERDRRGRGQPAREPPRPEAAFGELPTPVPQAGPPPAVEKAQVRVKRTPPEPEREDPRGRAEPSGQVPRAARGAPIPEPATFGQQPTVIVPQQEAPPARKATDDRRPASRGLEPEVRKPEPARVAPAAAPRSAPTAPRRGREAGTPPTGAQTSSLPAWLTRERMLMASVLVAVIILAAVVTSLLFDPDPVKPPPEPNDEVITITGGPVSEREPVAAGSNQATLAVTSSPSGARIRIDGAWLPERTPAQAVVAAGRSIEVMVVLENHQEYRTDVTMAPGETRTVNAILPERTGTITVESEPSQAEVSVDGQVVGRTPYTHHKVSMKFAVRVVVEKDGYQRSVTTVDWETGPEQLVRVELVPLDVAPPAEVAINAPREPAREAPVVRRVERPRAPVRTPREEPPEEPPAREPRAPREGRTPRRPPPEAAEEPAPRGGGSGKLSVQSRRWGSVLINGRLVSRETPLLNKPLPEGTYRVQVCFEGNRDECSPARTVNVYADQTAKVVF